MGLGMVVSVVKALSVIVGIMRIMCHLHLWFVIVGMITVDYIGRYMVM